MKTKTTETHTHIGQLQVRFGRIYATVWTIITPRGQRRCVNVWRNFHDDSKREKIAEFELDDVHDLSRAFRKISACIGK